MRKIHFSFFTSFIALILFAGFFFHQAFAKEEPLDNIVAVVGDHIITTSQLNREIDSAEQQMAATHAPVPPPSVLKKQILNHLIDLELQLQLANDFGISVDDNTVNQTLTNIAKQHGLTLKQLPDALSKQGIDYKQFRKDIRDNIIISQLQQKVVGPRIHISEREIDSANRAISKQEPSSVEYHLQDIVVALPENPTAVQIQSQQQLAKNLLVKLQQGASFEQTAVTEGKMNSSVKGGDLGFRKADDIPEAFLPSLKKMRPGETVGPIQTPNGFHLIKLAELRGATSSPEHTVLETHVRHILLKPNALNSVQDLKLRLADLRNKIIHGEDFGKLAQTNSEDPGSVNHGGDLGWVRPGMMDPSFEQVMDQLKPGEISQPFASQFGWHLMQVIARRQADNKQFMHDQARQELYKQKFEKEVENWLRQLRHQAYIKINERF